LNKFYDILLNIILPLLIGTVIYFFNLPSLLKNHLSDGLWAYSLISSILIIWDRRLKKVWLLSSLCLFILFEIFQSSIIMQGTADLLDIITYVLFGIFSVSINNLLKHQYYKKYEQ